MGSYTKITDNEVQEIVNIYQLGSVKSVRPLSLGISNSNYKVSLQDKDILLKISNDKNYEQLLEEQNILLYLSKLGFPYSLKPLSHGKENPVYKYKEYYGVIFPFIEGIPPGPSDHTCFEIGKALAALHSLNHANDELDKLRKYTDVGFGPKEIQDYCQSPSCPEDFKEKFSRFFGENLNLFLEQKFEQGIIHGDLYYDNTMFNNNSIHYLLDFEQAGRGEVILDIGISISGSCIEKGRISLPLIKSFIDGYESVRIMPGEEKEFLTVSILLGLFSISLWRIKRFREGELNPQMKDSYRDLLYRAEAYYETIR